MADKIYKSKIGGEVSPSATVESNTGNVLALNNNVTGTPYNYAAPSNALEYTIDSNRPIAVRGFAPCLVNAPSEPKVWTGNYEVDGTTKIYYPKIKGATFTANTNMEIVVESIDGVNVRYFFLEL